MALSIIMHLVQVSSGADSVLSYLYGARLAAEEKAAEWRVDGSCVVSVVALPVTWSAEQEASIAAAIASTAKPKKAKKAEVVAEVPDIATSDELLSLSNDINEPTPKPKKRKKSEMEEAQPMNVQGAAGRDALARTKIALVGTLEMGHATAEATCKHYGGVFVRSVDKADYVVLGKRPGDKTVAAMQDCLVDTITEEEFIQMIRDGIVPGEIDSPEDTGLVTKQKK